MKKFTEVTKEEIIDVLLDAIDTGDWHTPSVGSLELIEHTNSCIYGKFKSSLHNTFWDEERTFNINANTIKIWEEELLVGNEGIKTKVRYKSLNNLLRLAKFLEPFQE